MSTLSRTLIAQALSLGSSVVRVCGFVQVVRDQKYRQFVVLSDVTGEIQVFHEKLLTSGSSEDQLAHVISSLTVGSAIEVIGTLIENPKVKLGGVELVAEEVKIASLAEAPMPIDQGSSLEACLDHRHLSLRFPQNRLTFQVQTTMETSMRDFWRDNGFIEIHSPKLMGTASESGAELFSLPYFGETAYLAQSPQFYKQMAMAAGFDRVFEIGPVFRANPSFTSRHDTEFTSVDMEVSWVDSHEDLMRLEESWLHHVIQEVAATHGEEIKSLFGVDVVVPTIPFPRMTLAAARDILAQKGHIISHKEDLDPQGERMLCEYVREVYGHEFVFVTDYPVAVRAFYHMRHPDNPELTKSFDLLWKGIEVTTGAQREHQIEKLMQQAEEKKYTLGPLQHYFDFFRYGCPPHGGFGVGLTRLLMMLLGRSNVREVTYLYRGPNRLSP